MAIRFALDMLGNLRLSTIYKLGQTIKGQVGTYRLTKEIYEAVWLATSNKGDTVIVKGADHPRIYNERDTLKRFQARAPIRQLLDEIIDPSKPSGIVLQHLDDDALAASSRKRFTKIEIKEVARTVLQALVVLHSDGYIHNDIKPSNILFNYKSGFQQDSPGSESRFAEIRLADFGNCVSVDSKHAREGQNIGTPIFRSPEATLHIPWGTASDIWSFGAMLLSLFFGDYHIFRPKVPIGHEKYDYEVLERMHIFFGPFPMGYKHLADTKTLNYLGQLMLGVPQSARKPFHLVKDQEFEPEDKDFICRIMKLDPRERPTAQQLLEDKWLK